MPRLSLQRRAAIKPSKVLAGALAALGVFLLVLALIVFESGAEGAMRLLALLLVAGALACGGYAAVLFLRRPRPPREPIRHSLGQRLVLLLIGAFALAVAGRAVVTGKHDASRSSRDVARAERPGEFWQVVSFYLIGGVVCVYLALRRPPE